MYTSNAWLLMNDCKHSILQVCGYRLRLHFDGYLSCYDFWTNAGSPDIHPVGWCEKTKHELHIPKGKSGGKDNQLFNEILAREPGVNWFSKWKFDPQKAVRLQRYHC